MVMCMFVIVSALTYLENHTDKRHTLFLANVNSLIAVARPPVCLSVCRLSSVMRLHPTQTVVNFGNFTTAFGTFGHLLTCTENLMEIVFGPIEGNGAMYEVS